MGTPTDTFEEKVNSVVSQMTVDDSGNHQIPDGVEASEEVRYAAGLVKRQRDTQGAFTKSQQKLKALESENNKLATSWEADAIQKLSNQEQAKLEELKVQDPEAWRQEIGKLEDTKRTAFQDKRTQIKKEASAGTEIERRTAVLADFNAANPEINITDDLIENDIPPRLTKDLENGVVTFEEYLGNVKEYMGKGKAIASGEQAPDEPNFAGARGGSSPTKEAINAQDSTDYNEEIF